jgi:hypothetical protein
VELSQKLGAYAGTAVEVIGVLGDEELELAESLQLGEGEVGCVGSDLVARNPPLRRGQAGVASGPHPVGAAEIGDAGVSADAGARKGDDVLGVEDPTRELLDLALETDDQTFSFSWSTSV